VHGLKEGTCRKEGRKEGRHRMTWILKIVKVSDWKIPYVSPQSERERERVSKRDVSPLFFFFLSFSAQKEKERKSAFSTCSKKRCNSMKLDGGVPGPCFVFLSFSCCLPALLAGCYRSRVRHGTSMVL